jgi:hypothetical protein
MLVSRELNKQQFILNTKAGVKGIKQTTVYSEHKSWSQGN